MRSKQRNGELKSKNKKSVQKDPVLTIVQDAVETPTQIEARRLYIRGLNVFPLLLGKKVPCYKWQRLQTSRLELDHEKYGLNSVFAGKCNIAVMTGHTSGNLVIIDAETLDAYHHHIEEARSRGIPLLTSRTSRGGHIWLRIAEGDVMPIPSAIMDDCELKSGNGYILAPPSIHPSGAIYQWDITQAPAPPIVSIHDIDWLINKKGSRITLKLRAKSPQRRSVNVHAYSPFSRKTQDYLINGCSLREGERNVSAFSAACDFAGNSVSEADARAKLVPIAIASGLSATEADQIITNAYSKTREPARKSAASILPWQRAMAFVESNEWMGRTSTTDRTIMSAFIECAGSASNAEGTFRAARRELAQKARCSVNTVQAAIARLTNASEKHYRAPLVCYAGTDKVSGATLWRFSDYVVSEGLRAISGVSAYGASTRAPLLSRREDFRKTDTLRSKNRGLRSSVSVLRNSDVLERGAIGQTGTLIYSVLSESEVGLTPKEIAEAANLSLSKVYNALKPKRVVQKKGIRFSDWA